MLIRIVNFTSTRGPLFIHYLPPQVLSNSKSLSYKLRNYKEVEMNLFKKIMLIFAFFSIYNEDSWGMIEEEQKSLSMLMSIGRKLPEEPQTALITGASRGIGFSLVKQLLKDKIKVIAIVRNSKSLEFLADKYSNLQIIEADLSSSHGVSGIAGKIQDFKIDYLIHNAAIIEPLGKAALLEASLEILEKSLITNLLSPILLTASLNAKLTSGSRVLNISSRAGDQVIEGVGMYCVTKAGLDMYTKSLQLDHSHDILVASVHPGEVNTGMQENLRAPTMEEFPLVRLFQQNLEEGNLIKAKISASYLKWLLLKTKDEYFTKGKHNIYDKSHHLYWLDGTLPNPEL